MHFRHRRIPRCLTVLGNFIVIALILAGCSGEGTGFDGLLPKSAQPADGSADPSVTPLYHSASGIDIIALGSNGLEIQPGAVSLSVTEDSPSPDKVNLSILDNRGEFRPIYIRLRAKDSQYFLSAIDRGDWAQGAKALFLPIPTRDGDIDLGAVPLKGQKSEQDACVNKAIWKLTFSKDQSKSLSYNLPQQLSGKPAPGPDDTALHNFLPFAVPTGTTRDAHWALKDNHIEVYAPGESIDRDKVDALGVPHNPNVFNKGAYISSDSQVQFNFGFQLHGDYNQDQCVNIADLTPIGTHWREQSDYLAWDQFDDTITNPFRPSDPQNPRDPVNFIDGSMNGVIDVGGMSDNNYGLGIYKLPYNGLLQYNDDASPIMAHYQEAIRYINISFINTSQNNRIEGSNTLSYSSDKLVTAGGRVHFTYIQPLYIASQQAGLSTGVYDVKIELVGEAGSGGLVNPATTTTISGAFTVVGHDGGPLGPPYWIMPTEKGVLTAAPYAGAYRSLWIKFAMATVGTYNPQHSQDNIQNYIIKVKYYQDGLTPADVWASAEHTFYLDPQEVPDPPFMTQELSGYIIRGSNPNPPPADLPKLIWTTVGPPDVDDPNWVPNAKVVVLVTAQNKQGMILGVNNNIWVGGETGANLATSYLSYDYSPPTFEDSSPSPADADPEDILLIQPGAGPDGAQPSYEPGFYVYYGYGVDAQTGITGTGGPRGRDRFRLEISDALVL